jgi:hypothetical protein
MLKRGLALKAIATAALMALTMTEAEEHYNSAINLESRCKAVIEERRPYPNEAVYCLAVIDALLNVSAVMEARQSKDPSVCFAPPASTTYGQAMRVVVRYIEQQQPQSMILHGPLAQLALEALRIEWPCKP